MSIYILILIVFTLFYMADVKNTSYKYSLIEMRNYYRYINYNNNNIESNFVIFHVKNRNRINISGSAYFIEHNNLYDDILFLIPLYNIIIKSKIIVICNNKRYYGIKRINIMKFKNYTTHNSCIYIDISFLKYLHLHSSIFRFCKFDNVYNVLKEKKIVLNNLSVCKNEMYSTNYSIVTTVYIRNNLRKQIISFSNQAVPPNHIIVVHDRNIINVLYQNYKIIYIHIINFKAGFYFRYLLSLLSPENDVIIYDDDWYPSKKLSHLQWINKIQKGEKAIFAHRTGSRNGIRWCATPLLTHRMWLLLMWYNDIYETRAAEDGHLSFSLLLLCNIECRKEKINGLNSKKDNLSSSKYVNVSKTFWYDYTNDVKKKINTSYSNNIKNKYQIY